MTILRPDHGYTGVALECIREIQAQEKRIEEVEEEGRAAVHEEREVLKTLRQEMEPFCNHALYSWPGECICGQNYKNDY